MHADEGMKALSRELHVLAVCGHPNIVRLLGAGGLGSKQPFIVLEAMHCNLHHWLYDERKGPAQPRTLESILWVAREVACGLSYLHPTIVHRDLK